MRQSAISISAATRRLHVRHIDEMVVEVVKKAHAKATKILEENIGKLHEISKKLYEEESITGEQFMELLSREVIVDDAGSDA